jgi:hypothetical protein
MESNKLRPVIIILSIPTICAWVLCFCSCFDFNKTFPPPPAAGYQIVISSGSYGGTYAWSPKDGAYEAVILGERYYVYMDGGGIWHLSGPNSMSSVIANSTTPYYGTLPPQSSSRWSNIISGIDDSEGGVSVQTSAPDMPIGSGGTLQVGFLTSSSKNSANYQWQKSVTSTFDFPALVGTGSTYTLNFSTDYHYWFRVVITPTDSTGTILGTPVVSDSVYWP